MIVWPAAGDGTYGPSVLVRHVRFERTESAVDDAHRSADGGAGPSVFVRSCRRCCVVRGHVHHWELEVG